MKICQPRCQWTEEKLWWLWPEGRTGWSMDSERGAGGRVRGRGGLQRGERRKEQQWR